MAQRESEGVGMSDEPMAEKAQLKVTLVISGAIALGSYESGVIEELAKAARAEEGPFTIDVIAGTSAGSITGAQVAKVLTAEEPDFSSFALWANVTMDRLTSRYEPDETSPLSQRWIKQQLEWQLAGIPPEDENPPAAQTKPAALPKGYKATAPQTVRLLVTMTDLQGDVRRASYGDGINVPVDGCYNGVSVITQVGKETKTAHWVRIAQLVRASSAHPAAWEAVPVEVEQAELYQERWEPKEMYEALLKRETRPYFSDGGSVDNLPVGKALRLQSRDQQQPPYDPYRVVLYVEPDPVTLTARKGKYNRWGRHAFQGMQIAMGSPMPLGDLKWVGETNKAIVKLLELVAAHPVPVSLPPEITQEDNRLAVALQQSREQVAAALLHDDAVRPETKVLVKELLDGSGKVTQRFLTMVQEFSPNPPPKEKAQKPDNIGECVDAFYRELDKFVVMSGPAISATKSRDALAAHLDQAPTGSRPKGGGHLAWPSDHAAGTATDQIREAVVKVAAHYYNLKANGLGQEQALIQFHKEAARNSTVGDRQWAFVTRIVPGEDKPLSRSLGHFGGFLKQEWMKYDYELGRARAISWLKANFPSNGYVKTLDEPERPDPVAGEIGPALVSRNAPAIAAVLRQVQKALYEEMPWLQNKTVQWVLRIATAYTASALIYSLSTGVQVVAGALGADGLITAVTKAVDQIHPGWTREIGFLLSTALGAFYTWRKSLRPMEIHVKVIVLLWTLARVAGEVGGVVKGLFRRTDTPSA